MRNRTALLAAAAALAATTLVGTTATGATAQGPERNVVPISEVVPEADLAKMTEQRPLVEAADKIRWAQERGGFAGFTGIGLEEDGVALWWKGELPAKVEKAIAEARETAPVRVVEATYSLSELKAASARLQTKLAEEPSLGHTVNIPTDGSGLLLATDEAGGDQRAAAASQTASEVAGVPVRTVEEPRLEPVSRDNDWSPWWGGARIWQPSAGCTSGFGVTDNTGAEYLLTAGHCGNFGDPFTSGGGTYIGTPSKIDKPHDVMLIQTNDVTNFIYTGTPTDNVGVRVDGWDWVYPGEYLCQSGATSAGVVGGAICNIKVLFFYNDSEDLVEAEQMDGQQSARPGDSGGPIYTGSASGGAIAKGTTTRSAGARLGFQDFGTAWRDFGVWIAS
ncbi:trypsin-like serine protease [Streptomyces sp. NPDC002643]